MNNGSFLARMRDGGVARSVSLFVGLSIFCGAALPLPTSSIVELTVSAQVARKIAQDLLTRQAAYVLAAESTVDTDGFPLPPAMLGGGGPTGGGLVPAGSAAPKSDGYGVSLGYCAWDNGTVTSHAGRLAGANTMVAQAIAVISAGGDNVFDTTCANVAAGLGGQGDDYVVAYSAGQISSGVNGQGQMGMPVPTYADLVALSPVGLTDGQVRLVKATNSIYSYDSGGATWNALSSASSWADISGKPTTVAGFGITDAVTTARQVIAGSGLTGGGDLSADRTFALDSSGVVAGTYGSGTAIPVLSVDAFGRVTSASAVALAPDWSSITSTPTTLAGYGITDAVPAGRMISPGAGILINGSAVLGQSLGGADVAIGLANSGVTAGTYGSAGGVPVLTIDQYGRVTAASTVAPSADWSDITNKPTTIAGYGITDAVSMDDIHKYISTGGAAFNAGLSDTYWADNLNLMVGNGVMKTLGSLSSGAANTAVGAYSLASTATGSYNVMLGAMSGSSNVASSGNVGVGYRALVNLSNQAGAWDGNNTAVGFSAMAGHFDPVEVTGVNNVAVGAYAMLALKSGSNNAVLGAGALTGVTTGSNNVAIGNAAAGGLTEAGANVAIGGDALFYNKMSSHNVAIGATAMVYRTDGGPASNGFNTAVGSNAFSGAFANLASNTGMYNTALGADALSQTSSGSGSVAVGYSAGFSSLDGAENVFIGREAGASNVSGSKSVAIGYQAMQYANDSASAFDTGNTAIGYWAMRGPSTSSTNTGVGNTAVGLVALGGVTQGNHNVAMGALSLSGATVASDNVMLGYEAGATVIAGGGSVGVGYQSVYNQSQQAGAWDVYNTGVGFMAVRGNGDPSTVTGTYNTGLGAFSLFGLQSGVHNVAAGTSAMYTNTTGNYNAAFGDNAMGSQTTANYNVGLGANTLYDNKTSGFNVAVGYTAMEHRTDTVGASDGFNTAVGPYAYRGLGANLSTNTGINNTALGAWALYAGSSGSGSVAVGYSAGADSTIGGQNVVLGYEAGLSSVAGSSMVAVGYQAMKYANSATSAFENTNTAVGYWAIRGSSTAASNTGLANTGVGYKSLKEVTSGGYNVSVGSEAMQGNTTGDSNVAMGWFAMGNAVSLSDNVAIGANAMANAYSATGVGSTYNTAIGSNALKGGFVHIANNGSNNTAVGAYSLNSVTGANFNAALGVYALGDVTVGHSNTAVGYQAAKTNVGNFGLTAVGYNAMGYAYSAPSQSNPENSAFGYQALMGSVTAASNTGTGNTMLGSSAGVGFTSGSRSTGVGALTLASMATNSDNTGVGYKALNGAFSDKNTAVGTYALQGTLFGYGNTAMGYSAMSAPSGFNTNYNTIIGYNAGVSVGNGSNVFLGKGAGQTMSASTGSVVLGSWDAGGATVSDNIYIASGGSAATPTADGKLAAQFVYNTTPASGNGWTIYGSAGSTGALSCNYYTGTSWSCSSDARLKENVTTMVADAVVDRFMAVRPVNYNFIGAQTKSVGFIAQELSPLFPDMVATGANGYLTVTYTDMIPVITAVVQRQQKQIEQIQSGKLDAKVDEWARSTDGLARFYFAKSGETRIKGWGANVLDVRNAQDLSVAALSADGVLSLPADDAAVEFTRGAVALSAWADDSVNALVVRAKKAARSALELSDANGQVFASMFGDRSGFGLGVMQGDALVSGSVADGKRLVTVHGQLDVGDANTSRIGLAGGQALSAASDERGAFIRIESGEVRVMNPVTKEDVITLGSDGVVKAKQFVPTEMVQSWDSCAGKESHLARDEQGRVVVCER